MILPSPGTLTDGVGRAPIICVLWVALALGSPRVAVGQEEAPLYLSVAPESGELRIRIGDLLTEGRLTEALHSGLPVRIRIVAELWKDGFFHDSPKGRGEWRASVVYEPLESRYRVATGSGGSAELTADTLPEVHEALRSGFRLPLRPQEEGKFYYLGQVEVETLSLSDLEELQRWLRGDLAPSVIGDEPVQTAVGRGLRRALIRMLGLPARRFRVRTPSFEFGSRGPS
ncbi:MAG: hypothetical protein P8170_03345 [Gemmatimonadota bacterium]